MQNQKLKEYWDNSEQEAVIEDILKYKSRGSVLDLGAGSGRDSVFLANNGFLVTAVDNDKIHQEALKKKCTEQKLDIHLVDADINNYAPDMQFDVVVCAMVLHFFSLDEIKSLITKMQRWTSAGGLIVITAYSNKNPEGKRPYLFKINELPKLFDDWDILSYEEKPTPWFQLPGETKPRRNHAVYLVAKKLP